MLIIDDRYEVYNDNLEIDKFYKVKDIETNSYVFLKKLEQNKNIKDSFIPNLIDESTMILNLDSKYIANILDVISYESTYYVISEYFDGISLLDLANNKDLKTNDIISISKQIISAMKLCDERGLYHGAFRLDNVFIDKDYNIKIYDLGITKANGGVNIRMNNNIAFLCPHQLNVNYTDKESDFFAIGIIMYYCLFKKMPFKIGVNDREMLKNIDKGIDLNKDRTTALSKGLVDIIKKLFEGDCLEYMKLIPDGAVDMILCDLPYGMTQNQWDCYIPLEALWKEYTRIIKPNGAIVLTSNGIFTARLMLSQPKLYKYRLML